MSRAAPRGCAYFANDSSRDTVVLDPRAMTIADSRNSGAPARPRRFRACRASQRRSTDFADADEVARVHPGEIVALLSSVTGR